MILLKRTQYLGGLVELFFAPTISQNSGCTAGCRLLRRPTVRERAGILGVFSGPASLVREEAAGVSGIL